MRHTRYAPLGIEYRHGHHSVRLHAEGDSTRELAHVRNARRDRHDPLDGMGEDVCFMFHESRKIS